MNFSFSALASLVKNAQFVDRSWPARHQAMTAVERFAGCSFEYDDEFATDRAGERKKFVGVD